MVHQPYDEITGTGLWISSNGTMLLWVVNNSLHRLDGPAKIKGSVVTWCLYGDVVTEERVLKEAVALGNKEAVRSIIWRKWKDE